jgi:drug/metabolite transporter (DMT)-like permease
MKLLTLQKRATIAGLFFYIFSIAYAFIDPTGNIKELNQFIERFEAPLFGDFNIWVGGISAFLSLGLYFLFYFLSYRNSDKSILVFVLATLFAFIVFISDMGPQLDSGINMILELIACTLDGVIIACLLLGRNNEA